MGLPNFYTLSFEDLVGRKGGGSAEKQIEIIKELAQHLEIELTEEKLSYALQKLFGNIWTFRAGQIDEWKNHFTPERTELFKNNFDLNFIVELGYEKIVIGKRK